MDEDHVAVVTRGTSYVIDLTSATWRLLAVRDGRGAENVFAARLGDDLWTFAAVDRKGSERFDADAGTWTPTLGGLEVGRDMATALVLESGRRYMMTGGVVADLDWEYAKTS